MQTFEEQKQEFLEHAGVKGVRWGHRKTGSDSDSGSGGKIGGPSTTLTVLFGALGRGGKDRYTNPEALQRRNRSGKLFIASLATGVASSVISGVGRGSQGALATAGMLNMAAGGLGVASLVNAVGGSTLENRTRRESASN